MPIVINAEEGSTSANSYSTEVFVDSYHEERGNTYWDSLSVQNRRACMVRATDYIDKRFGQSFRGSRMQKNQSRAFPRLAAFDDDDFSIDGVPLKLKQAQAEYALRAAIYNVLAPDPLRPTPSQDMDQFVNASGVLSLSGNAVDAETVTIGSTVYTWESGALDAAYKVLIGATASDSIDNLIAAITGATGSGTLYAANTPAHPSVGAVAGTGDTMEVAALISGASGNAIATTETMTAGAWGAVTLTGGVNGTGTNENVAGIIVGPVKSKRVKIGPIEKETSYEGTVALTQANQHSSRSTQSNIINDIYVPQYPEADMLIEPLLDNNEFSATLVRA